MARIDPPFSQSRAPKDVGLRLDALPPPVDDTARGRIFSGSFAAGRRTCSMEGTNGSHGLTANRCVSRRARATRMGASTSCRDQRARTRSQGSRQRDRRALAAAQNSCGGPADRNAAFSALCTVQPLLPRRQVACAPCGAAYDSHDALDLRRVRQGATRVRAKRVTTGGDVRDCAGNGNRREPARASRFAFRCGLRR